MLSLHTAISDSVFQGMALIYRHSRLVMQDFFHHRLLTMKVWNRAKMWLLLLSTDSILGIYLNYPSRIQSAIVWPLLPVTHTTQVVCEAHNTEPKRENPVTTCAPFWDPLAKLCAQNPWSVLFRFIIGAEILLERSGFSSLTMACSTC